MQNNNNNNTMDELINTTFSNTRLAVIPARSGSKGIKRKCEQPVGGIPLLTRSITSAKQAKTVDRVIVSTDDQKFAELAQESEAEIPYLRPAKLAADNSSVVDAVIHLCNYLKYIESSLPSYILLIQPTSPFVTYNDIDEAFSLFKGSTKAVVSVCESEIYPDWLRKCDSNGWLTSLSELEVLQHTPRQLMGKILRLNGAIYWIKTKTFIDKTTFLPQKTKPFIMPHIRSIDIDNETDLRLANILASELNHVKCM